MCDMHVTLSEIEFRKTVERGKIILKRVFRLRTEGSAEELYVIAVPSPHFPQNLKTY